MPGTTTEQIKEKLDIVQYLREFLTLTPAGKNFKANCPFHKEKSPSFMVSPDRQTWHCFGCGLGGDIFAFLMRHENIEFGEALRILAEKAGVELRRLNPAEYKFTGLLHEINQAAKIFFQNELERNKEAQEYLNKRGLTQDTIREFEIGFAPQGSENLNLHLLKQKYSPEDVLRAGLVIKTERGSVFDRFRGRIMFPIHDHFGKCVGFTGRILPQFDTGEMGKYVNSPETQVFNKSKLLYGFNLTKQHIRDAGWALLVEGQMDLIMSYQAGVKNVAASSGTALTADHLRTLRRTTDRLMLAFDSDQAGLEAAERAIDMAEAHDFAVKVVRFQGFKDPAEAAQAGPEIFKNAIKAAVPGPEFYFDKYLPFDATQGKPVLDRRDRKFLLALRAVLSKLQGMASAVDRDFWMKELSRRVGIEERVLLEEAEGAAAPKVVPRAAEAPGEAVPERQASRWDLLSEQAVAACLARSDFGMLAEHAEYLTADYRMIHDLLKQGEKTSQDARLNELMDLVSLRADEVSDSELKDLKDHLRREHMRARRKELIGRIKKAELDGDETLLLSTMQELKALPVI